MTAETLLPTETPCAACNDGTQAVYACRACSLYPRLTGQPPHLYTLHYLRRRGQFPCGCPLTGAERYARSCGHCGGTGRVMRMLTLSAVTSRQKAAERAIRRAYADAEALLIKRGLLRRPTLICEAQTRRGTLCKRRCPVGCIRCPNHGARAGRKRKIP